MNDNIQNRGSKNSRINFLQLGKQLNNRFKQRLFLGRSMRSKIAGLARHERNQE